MPEVVVAFSFGSPDSTANRWLATKANLYASEYCLALATQKDIVLPRPDMAKKIFIAPQKENECLTTLQLAKWLRTLAVEQGWDSVALVAADPHIKRCIRDLKKMGFAVSTTHYGLESFFPFKVRWFDKRSPYWYMRSPFAWWVRETIIRHLPWRLYEKITG